MASKVEEPTDHDEIANGNPNLNSELSVPESLEKGMMMTKISEKKHKKVFFKLDADGGRIIYESRNIGCVPIESIQEIRTGDNIRSFVKQFKFPADAEHRWIAVIYVSAADSRYRILHLVADTVEIFELWNGALRKLFAVRQGLMVGVGKNRQLRESLWERQYWKGADVEKDRKLSFQEVQWLCWKLQARLPLEEMQKLFETADGDKRGYLDFSGFQTFVRLLKRRPDVDAIYYDVCGKTGTRDLDLEGFKTFMRDVQKCDVADDAIESIFDRYTSDSELSDGKKEAAPGKIRNRMTRETFSAFLLSEDNAVLPSVEREGGVWQDMTYPISEYFISSSHNTYLVGNQLTGVSTVEGYIRALLHSCRTVEVDVYDGSPEPVVFHGKTLTSSVPLRDICSAISKYAFVTSPYPVIISAEVHCGVEQQEKMFRVLVDVFGDALVQAPPDGAGAGGNGGSEKIVELPSPEELKGRVLLKAKNLFISPHLHRSKLGAMKDKLRKIEAELADTSSSESSPSDIDSDNYKVEELVKDGIHGIKKKWQKITGKPSHTHTQTLSSSLPGSRAPTPTPTSKPGSNKKVPMSFSLASLIVYTVGVKFHGFGPGASYAPEHVCSLSENTVKKILKGNPASGSSGENEAGGAESIDDLDVDASTGANSSTTTHKDGPSLVKHTRRHLVRTYPKGIRIVSTNYNPLMFWAVGAQVVALNWQTFDVGYVMNMAMFQRNGRAGYVLKPKALRPGGEELLLTKYSKHVLEVTVISGQQLPSNGDGLHDDKTTINPFVQVTLHVPDWKSIVHGPPSTSSTSSSPSPSLSPQHHASNGVSTTSPSPVSHKTRVIKQNGFNPVWQETIRLPFDCAGGTDMRDLIFVEFSVRQEEGTLREVQDVVASYCTPLGCLQSGYRYLPLHDCQRKQYLFATLFVRIDIRDVDLK